MPTTTKNGPAGAVTPDEPMTIPKEINNMTKYASPSAQESTEDSRMFAAAYLADLPIVTVFGTKKVRSWTNEDGETFSTVGAISVDPTGTKRFKITLRRGVTDRELKWLNNIVSLTKAGRLPLDDGMWTRRTDEHGTWWTFTWDMFRAEPDHHTYWVHECIEPACENYGSDSPYHYALTPDPGTQPWFRHHHPLDLGTDSWSVDVIKVNGDDAWLIDIEVGGEDLTGSQAAALASDIHWATAEVAKLNAPLVLAAVS